MTSYLIESSICLACFYTFYWLFLRSEKLLTINRAYLIITAVLAISIPLFDFDLPINVPSAIEGISSQTINPGLEGVEKSSPFTIGLSLTNIYAIGVIIASIILLLKIATLKKRLGAKFSLKNKRISISQTDGFNAYSFLNTIYIGQDIKDNEQLKSHVIAHELAHIRGKHSVDIFFFEILQCVFWFNPFSYFYLKSIKLQHEYIADDQALKLTNARSYEKSLLELTLSKLNTGLVSSFSEHPIQKRLNMIQKLNSNVMKKFKPFFALPVIAILIIGFACTPDPETEPVNINDPKQSIDSEAELITEQKAAFYDTLNVFLDENRKPVLIQGILKEQGSEGTTTIDITDKNSDKVYFESDVLIVKELKEDSNNTIVEQVRSEYNHKNLQNLTENQVKSLNAYHEKPVKVTRVANVRAEKRKQ
ncbi:M56 family metallopeptidase [Roseivirga misakiensis]|uniref:Peptidase M56 domain-containing protein n=1 Tax=Roseivirga misakiensis TaxID=1563681 RepID=A0A1E5SKH0_9BACT|nr:M56 family metallopeptidase [Roseivirga misakiensis]OEJ99619.1 hypothetical protein BFP71_08585 [Roseivirga misakiensis]